MNSARRDQLLGTFLQVKSDTLIERALSEQQRGFATAEPFDEELRGSRVIGIGSTCRVYGLSWDLLQNVGELRELAGNRQIDLWIDPEFPTAPLLDAGFTFDGSAAVLHLREDRSIPDSQEIAGLQLLRPQEDAEWQAFSEALIAGFEMGYVGTEHDLWVNKFKAQFLIPDCVALLATINEEVAGMATLYRREVELLGIAATLPAFRRRGLHRQLIQARVQLARGSGLGREITVDARVGSQSAANLQRAGFDIVGTYHAWDGPSRL